MGEYNTMNRKKRMATSVVACAMIGFLGAGMATYAYLTDAEKTENIFTVGNVAIELEELLYPGNDSPEVKNIVPNEEIAKNPTVLNNGINDAVAFMTVDSPMEKIHLVGDDGSVAAAAVQEIFWFKQSTDDIKTHANSFDADWIELPAKEKYYKIAADGTETEVAESALATTYDGLGATERLVKRYVFAYKNEIQGSDTTDADAQTAANKVTSELFDKVQLKNCLENEIDKMTEKIGLRAYAIQSDELLDADGIMFGRNSATQTEAGTLTAEDAGAIYDIFVAQNSDSDNANGALQAGKLRDADSVQATGDGRATAIDSNVKDAHVNRWDGTTDVTGAGQNLKP